MEGIGKEIPERSATVVPIISLFSGAGGLDLGFELAGFEPLLAYDVSPVAVDTYNYNRGKNIARVSNLLLADPSSIIQDIQNTSSASAPEGIIAGPPCQGFSNSNVYPKDDDIRRTTPGRFAYLLKALNVQYGLKFFVFENVRGLTMRRYSSEFARFRSLFEEAGFHLHEALLNAKNYGVPQSRPRVFIVGLNREILGSQSFSFPVPCADEPLTVRQAFESAFGSRPWPEPVFYRHGLSSASIPFHPNHWTMQPRSPKFGNGSLVEGQIRGRSFRVLAWERPSWTVAYGHREIHIHPDGKRRLSVFEASRLQGFPVRYVFLGTLTDQFRLVSDAVPPPLAHEIAKAILLLLKGEAS